MKWIRVIFIVVSIIISSLIVYAIINTEISYKYEIEGRIGDRVDIQWVAEHLFNTIQWLKYFWGYVVANIIYLLASMFYKR